MTLGGSPTAVAVPPMLENTTSAISTGRGSRFSTWHSLKRGIEMVGKWQWVRVREGVMVQVRT